MCRLAAYLLLASTANAATFFGPTPYLSQADSPFNLSGLGSTFFLEDFEDGLINTPGLSFARPLSAIILPPSDLTDSVDADDGTIDGAGTDGYSLLDTGAVVSIPTGPPAFLHVIEFKFDETELGYLPTAFGFVWTDGPPGSNVGVLTWNADGDQDGGGFAETFVEGLGDTSFDGQTSEDRFLGIRRDDGIAWLEIIIRSTGAENNFPFEIDHVQYGLFVPEPSTAVNFLLALVSSIGFFLARQRPFIPELR